MKKCKVCGKNHTRATMDGVPVCPKCQEKLARLSPETRAYLLKLTAGG